uniref:uncharacterized protein LOC101242098 isoform X2 n=1 Tax=Ciona intestinalis TaxID=7719 RepID=UPI000EF46309|nr:uncharacterized protein LOC101242098 isoform X2 [Ciona intestinalis]|eukprot:XP_026689551.1 uncharacterized protein LOC101242098 isoform X2 [Ciona intestinalis]
MPESNDIDGGWGWCVVTSAVIFCAIRTGVDRCLSVLYSGIMNEYNCDYSTVSQIPGLFYVGYAVSGLIASPLIKRFGYRLCMIVAGLVGSISCFVASLPGPFMKIAIFYGIFLADVRWLQCWSIYRMSAISSHGGFLHVERNTHDFIRYHFEQRGNRNNNAANHSETGIAISKNGTIFRRVGSTKIGTISKTEASFLTSAEAIGEIIAKLGFMFFFTKIPVHRQKLFICFLYTINIVLFAILPSVQGYPGLLANAFGIGVAAGGIDGVYSVFCIELFAQKYFSSILGYTNTFSFCLCTATALFVGYLIDVTGKLSSAFYFGSLSYGAAFLLMLLLHRITR